MRKALILLFLMTNLTMAKSKNHCENCITIEPKIPPIFRPLPDDIKIEKNN